MENMLDKFQKTYLDMSFDLDKINQICQRLSKFDFKIIDYSINKSIEGDDSIFINKYRFQKPEDTIKFHCGTCWDISCAAYFELIKLGLNPIIIYYQSNEKSNFPANHMFLVLTHDEKYYSFEASWSKYIGVHGPYNQIFDIFDQYAKNQILSVKNIDTINFYNVLKFPEYLSNVKTFMSTIKLNPLVYTFTTKKYFTHGNFRRRLSEAPLKVLNEETKNTLHDLIFESEIPSPYFLKDDIKNKIQKSNLVEYTKQDLKRFIDKDWKYVNEFKKLNNSFKLTIIECDENDVKLFTDVKDAEIQARMCEFYDPKNILHEYIWVKKNAFETYDDSFLTLLNHELGHVWTSVFGFSNDEFTKGRTDFNHKNLPNRINFNQFQNDVFITFYNSNYDILMKDYNYIIKNDQNQNWELTTHCDQIIEILVQDYLTYHHDLDPKVYISDIFCQLERDSYCFNDLTLLDTYKNSKTYQNFEDSTYIRNIIRRLFLLFAFGNQKQLNYFKNICQQQFGKIL